MKKVHQNTRVPRLQGLTALMDQYHKCQSDELKTELLEKVRSYIINQWLMSSGLYCGKYIDMNNLCTFLGVLPERVNVQMRDTFLSSKIWDKDNQEKIMYALAGQSLSWTLQDRLEVEQQLNLLKTSQGGKYMPFISAEVTKALGLKLQTSSQLQGLIKTMSGGGSINIFNNIPQQPENQIGVTKEEAMQMIMDQATLPSNPEVALIEGKYDMAELPEVVATKQTGIDVSKEGLDTHVNTVELKQVMDVYHRELDEPEDQEDEHEIRREREYGLSDDDEDPEMSIYDD